MAVGINKVSYIEYFTADQDSETEFDNRAFDQMLTEDELVDMVASDIAVMKKKQQKSAADYYASGAGEGGSDNAGGTLFKVVLSPEKEAKIRTIKEGGLPTIGNGLRILDDFASGTKIPTSVIRRLSEGVDPSTGETLNKFTKSYFDKARYHPEKLVDKNGEKSRVPRLGYDLTFSIDKAASVLWSYLRVEAEKTGDMRLVRKIENLVETSAAKSIQLMFDNDVFKTRRAIMNTVVDPQTGETKQVRTEYLEPVLDITSALYLHKTARPTSSGVSNGDPQLHVHALVLNSIVRQDGSIGSLENNELMRMRPVMDAAFKTAFYEGLLEIEEFKHLDIIKREKVVDIGGIDQKLIQEFSARREEILDELDAMDMPHTREASTIAAKNTRRTKDEQPNVQGLLPEWEAKISQYSKDGIYADTKNHQRDVLEESYEEKLERLSQEAIERIGGHQTIVSERDLLAEATRVCIGERGVGFDGIKDVVTHLKTSHLIIAEPDDRQEITWAIKHLADKEIQFLLDIKNSEKLEPVFSSDEIATRLKELEDQHKADPENVRLMNAGQVGMFEYVLSSEDQVICVEGSAGTGKTTTMLNINNVFKEKGYTTWGLSPSWKAAGGLGNELGLDPDKNFAITKFINMLTPFTDASGREIPAKVKLTSKDIVIVDEAAMTGVVDAAFLLKAVKEASAKLVLIGDTLQLSPVSAGDSMSMAIRVNGGYRLDTIVRQHNPASEETLRLTARMREASGLFVESGKSGINKNKEGSRADAENMSDEMKAASNKGKTGDPHIAKALGIYREEGKILFEKDGRDTFNRIAQTYAEFAEVENFNLSEILVVTNRNKDVHTINAITRQKLIKMGLFGEDEISFSAYRRDEKEDTIGHNLKLRAKERVIFGGKQIEIDGFTINNSDFATVVAVETGKAGQEPKLTLRFDKTDKHDAFTITVSPSQLSAEDRMKDRDAKPVLQHAYAVTVHASQGATVNQAIVANVNGIDYRMAYVGTTRHRHNCVHVVNTKRMEVNALVNDGLIITEENGKLKIPHPEGKEDIEIDPEEYKLTEDDYFNRIVFEASQSESKSNFTGLSFYKDDDALVEFLDDENRYSTHYSKLQAQGRLKEEDLQRKIINNKARHQGTVQEIAGVLKNNQESEVVESDKLAHNNDNTRLNTTVIQLKAPSERQLKLLKGTYTMNHDLLNSLTKDISKLKFKETKWNSELESQYRGEMEAFLLAHGAVQNPKIKNRPHQINLCDGVSGGEGFNTYTFTLKSDGNFIYNQWNDGAQRGVLESWLVNKGVAEDYKQANSIISEQFPLHQVRSAKLKGTNFTYNANIETKPKDPWAAYQHSVDSALSVTTFATKKYGDLDPIENLHAAVAESKLPSAMGDTIKRGQIAQKWLDVIRPLVDDNAKERDKELAKKAYEILEKGGSFPEFEWKAKLENPRQTDSFHKDRAIETATLRVFQGDVKRTVFLDHATGKWNDGLAFAHRHVINHGTITGIEYKMPPAQTKSGFEARTSNFSAHPGKGVGMLGQKYNPEKVVIVESGLDAMSHWQKHNLPADFKEKRVVDQQAFVEKARENNKTLYLSVGGSMSTAASEAITVAAQKYPNAKFEMAFDNDMAGFAFQEKAKQAIKQGNPKAEIKESQLPIFVKDWNDLIKIEAGKSDKLQYPADISREFVGKASLNASSKQYELAKLPMELYERFTPENLVREAEAFKKSHPKVFEQLEARAAEYTRKSGIEVADTWKPEAFKEAAFTDSELAYVKQKYAAYMDRDKTLFTQKVQTAAPVTQRAAVSMSSGFGMKRPAHLMNGMKPKIEEVSKPVRKHNFGMQPKPDTSLSIARIQQQNAMTRDAEAKRIHARQIEEAARKKQLEEEKQRQKEREAADNASKMKM